MKMSKKTEKSLKNIDYKAHHKKMLLLLIVMAMLVFSVNYVSATSWITGVQPSAYYKFDELLNGSNAIDSSGNSLNLINRGRGVFVQGKIGNAGRSNLTGANAWTVKGNNSFALGSGNFTVAFWYKGSGDSGSGDTVFGTVGSGGGWTILMYGGVPATPSGKISWGQESATPLISTTNISDNNWHRVIYTRRTNNLTLWVDGVNQKNYTTTNNFFNNTVNFTVNTEPNYNQVIDELVIWNNYSLTNAQIFADYNGGEGTSQENISINVNLISPNVNTTLHTNTFYANISTIRINQSTINSTLFIWNITGDLVTAIFNNNSGVGIKNWIINLDSGTYIWNVYAEGINSSLIGSSFAINNITFSIIPFVINSQTYNTTTFETSIEGFVLNISFDTDNYQIGTALLNYNGIYYTPDSSTIILDNAIYTKALDIPTVSSQTNYSFFWNISLVNSNGTFKYSINPINQTINNTYLTVCNTTITTKSLNFTFADEETLIRHNSTFNAIFNYSLGSLSYSKLYSYNVNSIGEVDICIYPSNRNFYSDMAINYNPNSTIYGTRFFNQLHYFMNATLNPITLYSLKINSLTTFIILVQDNNLLPVPNVIVETWKFEPTLNQFILVQTGLTDTNGQTSGQFIINSANYRFVVRQNGNIIYTSSIQVVTATTLPYTITIAIGTTLPNPWLPLTPLDNLQTGIVFNKTTNRATWTYSDTSNNFTRSNFIVAIQNYTNGRDLVVCNITSTNIAAIQVCDLTLTGNKTGVYYANGFITRGSTLYLADSISFVVESFSSIMGGLGILLGMFIIIVSAMAFKFNEIAGVWLTTIACLGVNMLGLISFGPLFITGIIALAIVLTVMFKQ